MDKLRSGRIRRSMGIVHVPLKPVAKNMAMNPLRSTISLMSIQMQTLSELASKMLLMLATL
jgi:hypothetical protein